MALLSSAAISGARAPWSAWVIAAILITQGVSMLLSIGLGHDSEHGSSDGRSRVWPMFPPYLIAFHRPVTLLALRRRRPISIGDGAGQAGAHPA